MAQTLSLLKRPVITERSTALKVYNQYVFAVDLQSTKGQIREAVEAAFHVTVTSVNTARMKGKARRRGQQQGYTSDWKKAIVTIKKGQEIKFAEPKA